jgi:hypothetical protein
VRGKVFEEPMGVSGETRTHHEFAEGMVVGSATQQPLGYTTEA